MKKIFFILIVVFFAGITDAKYTQNFETTTRLPKDILQMDYEVQRKLTIGKVSKKAVTKYKNFEEYWKVCKTQATGKGFEALAVETYNKATPYVRRSLCTTAALKSPHDVADVLRFNNNTRVIHQAKYQFKSGYSSSLKALRNSDDVAKYIDCTIVTTSDTFQNIKKDLAKAIANHNRRGVPLPPKWKVVENAINSGKLTATIDNVPMPTLSECELFTKEIKRAQWDEVLKLFALQQTKNGALKRNTKLAIKTARLLTKKFINVGGKYFYKGTIITGYAFSAYSIYDSWNAAYHGQMDRDIAAARIGNATAQITFDVMGPVILTTLSVPGGGWVAGGIMLVGTAGFMAVDMWIEDIQKRRDAENRRLLKQIDHRSRCEAARTVLMRKF